MTLVMHEYLSHKPPKLISLDIGGTIGFAHGQSIATILTNASTSSPREVQRILRETLYVSPILTDSLIDDICGALGIHRTCFPKDYISPHFEIYPWALLAVKLLSDCATVVTLSNVSCLDAGTTTIKESLGMFINAYYPSCEIGLAKPDPLAFHAVAGRHGIPTDSLLHIGDDWECDIFGALSAGARAIWIAGDRAILNNRPTIFPHRLIIARDLAEASKYLCYGS
jgi:FMN phosphatase YigB (HAD superfamily)